MYIFFHFFLFINTFTKIEKDVIMNDNCEFWIMNGKGKFLPLGYTKKAQNAYYC